MAGIELGETLKTLKAERAKVHENLARLDEAIAVLKELSRATATSPNGSAGQYARSAATRRKMAKAQKLRWAKLKQQAAKK